VAKETPMTKPHTPKQTPALPAELAAILERGHAGDATALPAIKRAFDQHPQLTAALGDLSEHAESAVLSLITGPSLTAREAVARHADGLRRELLGESTSRLERLLVERLVLAWLWAYEGDLDLADRLRQGQSTGPAVRDAVTRLNRAQQRLLGAAKSLALVRRLLAPPKPSRSPKPPLALLGCPAPELAVVPPRKQSGAASRRAGAPVGVN
jgi:hypothetical protein